MTHSRLLLAYYGDDFTGSTDCLEVLEAAGIPTILYLVTPSLQAIEEAVAGGIQAVGVAGVSRSLAPLAMKAELVPVFHWLAGLPARLVHYKVCSTFDSSPTRGSIGLAMDLARPIFSQATVPVLAGSPRLGRYTVFGEHFAEYGGRVFRLDRHPTMAVHPATPMNEADLRRVLLEQSTARVQLMNLLQLSWPWSQLQACFREQVANDPGTLLFDVLDSERLAKAGRLLLDYADRGNRLVVGSSGVEEALIMALNPNGRSVPSPVTPKKGPLLILSGSCSPATAGQIRFAGNHGFSMIPVPLAKVLAMRAWSADDPVVGKAVASLKRGRSAVLYTALGQEGVQSEALYQAERQLGDAAPSGAIIGEALGQIGKIVLRSQRVRRMVLAGGDTAGYAAKTLGIQSLRYIASTQPGAPLCRTRADDMAIDGLEVVFKGGQVGAEDYFTRLG